MRIKLRLFYESGNISSESLYAEKVSDNTAIIITEPFCSSDLVPGNLVEFDGERIVGKAKNQKLPASEYYFQVETFEHNQEHNDFDADQFWIVPKAYYDAYHHLDDDCNKSNVPLPYGFSECMGSCFEYSGDTELGKQLLIAAGFVEYQILG